MLAKLEHPEEALEQAHFAIRIFRPLAPQQPDTFLPHLAMALHHLAFLWKELGREEALEAAREAVGIYRQLAERRPATFRGDLAMSLDTLAAILGRSGHREE